MADSSAPSSAPQGSPRQGTLARPVPSWRTYAILLGATWRSMRVHRMNLVLTFLGSAALQGTQLAFIGVLLNAFGTIAGWDVAEVAFLYGLRLTAHGVCTINFGQHRASALAVRNGDWDRYLLRPAPPLMQLLTRFFNPGTLGDLVLGAAILLAAASRVDITWSAWSVVYVALAAIGGGLVEAGLQIGVSGLDFRMGPTTRVKDTIDRVLTDFGAYPMTIFGTVGTWLLTFLLPLAFMAYLPATVVLGHTEDLVVPLWLAQLSPLAGPVILVAGVAVFRYLSRWYASPGH
ncbi:ABC transporter permease [Brachybacterium alimentarium]|uniref:ABC transporter permease n=1 Tax=Brachybacterium alimentarium TaxID=47845 RepID=UPI000DF2F4A5|nr:ABC-2 family transporter protein [Brachybacterium alimentarium]RCS74207.1 ABC transporter permease [Brachybacterium alimentarium]RCS78162.1 ABC transporter permease [Brachybacterium alimentarium]RCS79951.1 ABC transporter permease [Brachybacterium alimentarium]RCS81275.1 ABC transporter permease [Brachybacterium alimentarium]